MHSQTETFSDAPRSGQPCSTSVPDDWRIKVVVQQHRSVTLLELSCSLASAELHVSTSMIIRHCKAFNLRSYNPVKKPKLTPQMAQKRLQFARRHSHWRPSGQRFNPRNVRRSHHEAFAFLPTGTTMNGQKYLEWLQDKLKLHMEIHGSTILMQDGAPRHRSKLVTPWLTANSIEVLEWLGNSVLTSQG